MIQETLFGTHEIEKARTLGFYEPFGTLMVMGKIETRWVKIGKKPPFPLGKYLFYTTQKECTQWQLFDWCGPEILSFININTNFKTVNESIVATADLVSIRKMTINDEQQCFVKFKGELDGKIQWCLVFENVKPLERIPFKENGKSFGKQGVGFVPECFKHLIQ